MRAWKKTIALALVVVMTLSLGACGGEEAVPVTEANRGNTIGNVANGGRVASDGERIYYKSVDTDGYLYSMKPDGSDRQALNKNEGSYGINLDGDTLYYCADSRTKDNKHNWDNQGLYALPKTGGESAQLKGEVDTYMVSAGEWLYYLDAYSYICRIRNDGEKKKELLKEKCSSLNVVGEWMYFTQENDGFIYRCRLNGKDVEALNNEKSDKLNVVGDWIYYRNNSQDATLYKMKTDGSAQTQVLDREISALHVTADTIYYCDFVTKVSVNLFDLSNAFAGRGIHSMPLDGGVSTQLSSDYTEAIGLAEGRLFYTNKLDGDALYWMKTDGSGREKLNP